MRIMSEFVSDATSDITAVPLMALHPSSENQGRSVFPVEGKLSEGEFAVGCQPKPCGESFTGCCCLLKCG